MPGIHTDKAAAGIQRLCKRCSGVDAALIVRAEPLCRDCFCKYIHTKVIKRMESFRVRNSTADQQRTLLLPLSFGVSSVTLLHVLHHHLQGQVLKTGRTGFKLHLLHIDCSALEDNSFDVSTLSDQVRIRYPGHDFAIVDIRKASIQIAELRNVLNEGVCHSAANTPSSDLSIEKVFASLPSPSSRSDMLAVIRRDLIVKVAGTYNCEAILWGDSTTKLSEKILAETAKGRGFSLPWQTADAESPLGVHFVFPMRDLLKKELFSYTDFTDPPLSSLVLADDNYHPSSAKNSTIDDLMKSFFQSAEENYPSIVANVLRTSAKLKVPETMVNTTPCRLCKMPIINGTSGSQTWNGDQKPFDLDGQHSQSPLAINICYGCARSTAISTDQT